MMLMSMAIFGTIGLFVRNIPVSSGELALIKQEKTQQIVEFF